MDKKVGLTLDRLFYQTLLRKRNEVLTDGDRYITYRDLFTSAVRLANSLKNLGLGGKRIAVIAWNSIEYATLMYGIPFSGSSVHPINVRLTLKDIAATIKIAKDSALFVSNDFAPVAEKLSDLGLIKSDDIFLMGGGRSNFANYDDLILKGSSTFNIDFDENTEMSVLFTSGTTGVPKGVAYTHRDVILAGMSILTLLSAYEGMSRLTSRDVIFPLIPFYHLWSWDSLFLSTLIGCKYVIAGKFDPVETIRLIKRSGATWMNMVPTMLYALLSADNESALSGMKVLIGGSPIPSGLVEESKKRGIELASIYGFTDGLVASVGTINENYGDVSADERYRISTRYSTPAPFSEVKVVEKRGSPPEIFFRSPWLPRGYLNDPEKTKESFTDGWFKPGDSGYLTEHGDLRIDDRVKDLVKSGGEFIPSAILESYISEIPHVQMVAVVPRPDEKWVERPVAFIKSEIDFNVVKQDIIKTLNTLINENRMPKWWMPDEFLPIDEMPMTGTGKIDKKELRKIVGG